MVQGFSFQDRLTPIQSVEEIPSTAWVFWYHNGALCAPKKKKSDPDGSSQNLPHFADSPAPFILSPLNSTWHVLIKPALTALMPAVVQGILFGQYEGRPCYMIFSFYDSPKFETMAKSDASFSWSRLKSSFHSIRNYFGSIPPELLILGGLAAQMGQWRINAKFCGRCGAWFQPAEKEIALSCGVCGLVQYPQIAPAIIVAVTKGDCLLLAHNKTFPEGLYSIVAGFCSPGESAEETLRRELREEVGIEVTNIRYFQSQPWPFPNSLMLGFTAEWASGEIHVDGDEITDARWFRCDEVPRLPSTVSISRVLINNFLAKYSSKS